MTTTPTTIQPFHTYHEYVEGSKLYQTLRIKDKRLDLSENEQLEYDHLAKRLGLSHKKYAHYHWQD